MKFFIRTYGCQMNERDTEAATAALVAKGLERAPAESDADVLILNTCSVRDTAERKVSGYILQMRERKEKNPSFILGIMGCMAQDHKEELLSKYPHLDFVVGTEQIQRLPEIIARAEEGERISLTDPLEIYDGAETHTTESKVAAFVAVMRGCDRFCSYCIVPYVRGREKSRPPEDVLREVAKLADGGVKEIFLLGQNIAAYGLDGKKPRQDISPLADIMREISEMDGVRRIRFTSPHPAYFNDALVDGICANDKVCNNVHIPLQSGSDRILKLMNRNYSVSHYLSVVAKLKEGKPGMTFSTDAIVGFPGETADDFAATRRVLDEVGFDQSFIFKYSPRRNTPAAKMDAQLPREIKEERNQILLSDLRERVIRKNKSLEGSVLEVLVDGDSSKRADRMVGKTTTNKTAVFWKKDGVRAGDMVLVRIDDSTLASLYGTMAPS